MSADDAVLYPEKTVTDFSEIHPERRLNKVYKECEMKTFYAV